LAFWDSTAAKLYGVRAIPSNVLIDPQGKIIARNVFGATLEQKLDSVYKQKYDIARSAYRLSSTEILATGCMFCWSIFSLCGGFEQR
jgi:hypothetical protein